MKTAGSCKSNELVSCLKCIAQQNILRSRLVQRELEACIAVLPCIPDLQHYIYKLQLRFELPLCPCYVPWIPLHRILLHNTGFMTPPTSCCIEKLYRNDRTCRVVSICSSPNKSCSLRYDCITSLTCSTQLSVGTIRPSDRYLGLLFCPSRLRAKRQRYCQCAAKVLSQGKLVRLVYH